MNDAHSHTGQGERTTQSPRVRPRSKRHTTRRPTCGPRCPGRFFKLRRKLHFIRLEMKPVHLGEADWILYRREFNPYRSASYKAAAYERGFAACKKSLPRPSTDPISW